MTKHTFNNIITYMSALRNKQPRIFSENIKFWWMIESILGPWYKDKLLRIFSFASASLRAIWAQDLIIIPIICNSPHPSTFLHPCWSSMKNRTVTTKRIDNKITAQSDDWRKYLKPSQCPFNPWPGPGNIVKECELNKNYCSFQHILKIFAFTDSFHLILLRAELTHSLKLISHLHHQMQKVHHFIDTKLLPLLLLSLDKTRTKV